jgi:hypothetical protein
MTLTHEIAYTIRGFRTVHTSCLRVPEDESPATHADLDSGLFSGDLV